MTAASIDELRRRGAAFALFARLPGPGVWDRSRVVELRVPREALAELGDEEPARVLQGVRGRRGAERRWLVGRS